MLKPLRLSYFAFEDKENLMNGNNGNNLQLEGENVGLGERMVCGEPVHISLANFDQSRGGGVLPMMAYTGRLHPKGVLFHASGI